MTKKIRDNLIRGGIAAGIVFGGMAADPHVALAADEGEMVIDNEATLAEQNTVTIAPVEQLSAAALTPASAVTSVPEIVMDAVSQTASQTASEAVSNSEVSVESQTEASASTSEAGDGPLSETPAVSGSAQSLSETDVPALSRSSVVKAGPAVPADDELDEEDIITDEDLMDDEFDMAGGGFSRLALASTRPFGIKRSANTTPPANQTPAQANQQTEDEASASASVSTSTSNSIDSHISSMKTRLSEEYKANSLAADENVEKERLVQYIKDHFSNGWVAKKETVTLKDPTNGNEVSGVTWVYKYTNNVFEGMKLNPKIEAVRDEQSGNEVNYFILYAEREDGSEEKDKYGTTSKFAYIWTKIGDVAKAGVTSAGRGNNRTPQVGSVWNEQGNGKGWLANEADENGNLLYPGAQYARDLTYTEEGTPAAEARQSGAVDDTNAKQLLGWQFLLVDLSWANYKEDPDNDGVLTPVHKSGDLQYDSKFATFVDAKGERHGYYDFVPRNGDINDNNKGTTTVFDRNDAPLINWGAMLGETESLGNSLKAPIPASLSAFESTRLSEIAHYSEQFVAVKQHSNLGTGLMYAYTIATNRIVSSDTSSESESESETVSEMTPETITVTLAAP